MHLILENIQYLWLVKFGSPHNDNYLTTKIIKSIIIFVNIYQILYNNKYKSLIL